jgi:hypothetical protein
VAFSDETNHDQRWFNCGWEPRAETALEIAQRLQTMARYIRQAQPELNPLWPYFSSRAIRMTDPGPVDEMAVEDLGRLIDRRARFDPPQLPAPVGPWGYSIELAGPPSPNRALRLGASINAGSVRNDWPGNRCIVNLHVDAPVWRDPETGLALLRALVKAWEPDGAGAYARFQSPGEAARDWVWGRVRPWLTWERIGAEPSSYEFVGVGNPALVQQEMGGELKVWS